MQFLIPLVLCLLMFNVPGYSYDNEYLTKALRLGGGSFQIEKSASPDNEYALFVINTGAPHDICCPTVIGLVKLKDHTVQHMIDGSASIYKNYLRWLWSPNGKLLAIHDASEKHSALKIYIINDEMTKEIMVPDLKYIALQASGFKETQIKSSGQVPIKWIDNEELIVNVRLRTSDNIFTKSFRLRIDATTGIQIEELGA